MTTTFAHLDFSTAGRETTTHVYAALKRAIIRNELPAGEPLSQVSIARELGVSTTPLREALRLLETDGLVQSETNRRVRVSPLSVADLEEVYTMRVLLEGYAISPTVTTYGADDVTALTEAYDEMTEHAHSEDYDAWSGPHRRFHQLLIASAGNRMMTTTTQLSAHAERYRYAYTTQVPTGWANGLREHKEIFDAAVLRDGRTAQIALCRHYARVALSSVALIDACHEPIRFRSALETLGVTGNG